MQVEMPESKTLRELKYYIVVFITQDYNLVTFIFMWLFCTLFLIKVSVMECL